ncbi:MAG: methionine--tRNA ligase subunit beta [Deltaproteobacteria bacterium]|nr:methionine--tRNA ligase subunit beta [Deltaproteobacteria bacterium]
MTSNAQPDAPVQRESESSPDDQIDIEQFAKIKLRVGRVESAEALPKSKKLIKLQVDLGGTLGKRQILAGVAQYYTPEQLIGKRIVVVSNLKPATLMGEQSQGMLLAASNDDGSALSILEPDEKIQLGASVR